MSCRGDALDLVAVYHHLHRVSKLCTIFLYDGVQPEEKPLPYGSCKSGPNNYILSINWSRVVDYAAQHTAIAKPKKWIRFRYVKYLAITASSMTVHRLTKFPGSLHVGMYDNIHIGWVVCDWLEANPVLERMLQILLIGKVTLHFLDNPSHLCQILCGNKKFRSA